MKKVKWTIIAFVIVTGGLYVFGGTALTEPSFKKYPASDSVLLKTHWQQMGGFERCTPDHMRLGCWSTALAQIMYYHRLKPFGHVAYTSRHGYRINEVMDSTQINFSKLALSIDSNTDDSTINALAKYNYYAALAVQKDFGTDSYMHKLASSSLLETHFRVQINRYISWQSLLPNTYAKLEAVIRKEISNKRPLFLHFANLEDFGHSVVVDGYKQTDKKFLVHLNQGQGGPQDGWYDFDQDLLKKGDHKLRVIYTIKPYND
jgi:peptidase C10-like protein